MFKKEEMENVVKVVKEAGFKIDGSRSYTKGVANVPFMRVQLWLNTMKNGEIKVNAYIGAGTAQATKKPERAKTSYFKTTGKPQEYKVQDMTIAEIKALSGNTEVKKETEKTETKKPVAKKETKKRTTAKKETKTA